MIRYFAIATAIVIGFLALVTAFGSKSASDTAHARYATASETPGATQRDLDVHPTPVAVTGDAPWALSALPECFRQLASRSGSPAYARTRIPIGARRVPPSTSLRVADCTLEVGSDSAVVRRGENRLRVPPSTRLYVAGHRLVVERREGRHEDVRIYALVMGTPPSFAPSTTTASP